MKWVLVAYLLAYTGNGLSVVFDNEIACKSAADDLYKRLSVEYPHGRSRVLVACYPLGGAQ